MSSRASETLVLSNGPAFAVLNTRGDIRLEDNAEAGLFFDDTRFLSRSTLEIEGAALNELSSETTREYVSQVDLTLAGERFTMGLDDPMLFFHVRRRQLIEHDMVERIDLANYHRGAIEVTLIFRHDADFVDLFEVRGFRRREKGQLEPAAVVDVATYDFGYLGRDELRYRTRVRYGRAPDKLEAGFASFHVRLEPLAT
jgi:glycogen debranching enzyme